MRSPVDGSTTKKTITTGDLVGTVPAGARHDLTDAQWRLLEPLLPAMSGRGRPRTWTRRQLIDGI